MQLRSALFVCLVIGVAFCTPIDVFEKWLAEKEQAHDNNGGKVYAVLIAGSNGYYNYRHQADICHAYHVLTDHHGIPKEQVIVMMYNDIAHSSYNPLPGKIINALNGRDVYEGVQIDYEGEDVTVDTFLKVLQGIPTNAGTGRVLKTGPADHIFVNFADHGEVGALLFPNEALHVADLTSVLNSMYQKKLYKQMLWYVEACESGSMFEHLDPTMNITAATASNARESSYACGWSDDLETFVGDCWSMAWMKNTEAALPNLGAETVEEQYQYVRRTSTQSHASIYGDLSIIYHEPLGRFMGHDYTNSLSEWELEGGEPLTTIEHSASVAVPDVLIATLERRLAVNGGDEAIARELEYHVKMEAKAKEVVRDIVGELTRDLRWAQVLRTEPQSVKYPDCTKSALNTFYGNCYSIQKHPYVAKYTFAINNLCNYYDKDRVVDAILMKC